MLEKVKKNVGREEKEEITECFMGGKERSVSALFISDIGLTNKYN